MGFRDKRGRENWAPDDSSKHCSCGQAFTRLKRRHHCRSCGGVFCDTCTNFQALVPTGTGGVQGGTKRVCQPCYNVLKETQKAKNTAQAGGGGADADLQFVQVAIGKIRQEGEVQQQRLKDRVEVLNQGLERILESILKIEGRIADGTSLFIGNTHDVINEELRELSEAYERRTMRAKELTRALKYRTMTAFFTGLFAKLHDILLHFVLAASVNETTASCLVSVLGNDYRISCRNLSTHFLRQSAEGSSVRDLCEVMQDVAEDASLRITFRFEEQISCLTMQAARTFSECILGRIVNFFKNDVVVSSKARMPPADLITDCIDTFPNIVHDPVALSTREADRDADWTDTELLESAAIKTPEGNHWSRAEFGNPYKYYYQSGTAATARAKGYTATGQNRNCSYPVFNLERAQREHRMLIDARERNFTNYYLSRPLYVKPGKHESDDEVFGKHTAAQDESEEKQGLLAALEKISDLLRHPGAYGHALLNAADAARVTLDGLKEKEKKMVNHSKDMVDAPGLSEQVSYISLQHKMHDAALDRFRAMMQDPNIVLFYAHLRLKLLQQLVAHRAYSIEAVRTFPSAVVGGSEMVFSASLLAAVDAVVAGDRSGVANTLVLLDESSHVIPRWLCERFAEQIPKLTPEGVIVFSDCSLARFLHAVPQAQDDVASPRNAGFVSMLGTGTIAGKLKTTRMAQPISATTCLTLERIPLEATVVGQRHVILPTVDASANWKEQSLVTKCGIAVGDGKFRGTDRHHKPQKYGYAQASATEAMRLGNSDGADAGRKKKGSPSPAPAKPKKGEGAERPVPEMYPPGCEVEAHSLQGAKDLNGLVGRVEGFETDGPLEGRLQIVFPQPFGEKAIKPANVWRLHRHADFAVGMEVQTRGTGDKPGLIGRVSAVSDQGFNVKFPGGQEKTLTAHQLRILREDVPNSSELFNNMSFLPPDSTTPTLQLTGSMDGVVTTNVSFSSPLPKKPASGKAAGVSWIRSTFVCTPRVIIAGASINCVLVIYDASGKKALSDVSATELDVLPFGHDGITLVNEPTTSSSDDTTFQFSLELRRVGTFPIGVACRGKCKISNNVTVVAAPIDWLGRSLMTIYPETTVAGEAMHGTLELRDRLGNLATSAGLEDFTVSVNNVVELATTSLRQADDGTFVFSFVPTEEGEIEVQVGFCGLLKRSNGYHECRAGTTDFKNTLIVLNTCEAEVGDVTSGVLVLRDVYGNRAFDAHQDDVELWLRAGDEETSVDLMPVAGEVGEFELELHCVRRGLVLLEARSPKTRERVVSKVMVQMPEAIIDWEKTTISLVPREIQAGSTVTCTILARDSYGNLLTDADSSNLSMKIISNPASTIETTHGAFVPRGGTITSSFEPLTAGTVWVVVHSGDGANAKKSNTVLVAAGALSWSSSTVEMKDEVLVGDSVPVRITARDQYGNVAPTAHNTDFQVIVWNESQRLEHSPVSGENGEFLFSFEPRAVGQAWAEVFYSRDSKESNRCAVLPGKISWDSCRVCLDRVKIKAGEVLRCDITLADKCGNETATESVLPSDFHAVVCDPEGVALEQATTDSTPVDGAGSSFWFQFSPTVVGEAMSRVSYKGATRDSAAAAVVPDVICWERSGLVFERPSSVAGSALVGHVNVKDRFGNASEVLRYLDDGYTASLIKETDVALHVKNHAASDHEVLEAVLKPTDEYGVFTFAVVPSMMGEVRAVAALVGGGTDVELRATADVRGGGIDWDSSVVVLNPASVLAGEEAVCTITVKDRYGNSATGAETHDFKVSLSNEGTAARVSEVVATSDSTFAFTAEPTRSGTACATVFFLENPKESNIIFVKPAALSFPNSTLEWCVPRVYAGDHLEGTLTFRDRFGNATNALPPEDVEFRIENEAKRLAMYYVDDYVSATETTQLRFYCEPTVRGKVVGTATRKSTAESIQGRRADVKPGPVDWTNSTTELPPRGSDEWLSMDRTVMAGEKVTAVVTCRDKYRNLACPGTESSFNILVKSNGQMVVSPVPYAPLKVGNDGMRLGTDEVSIYHFDLVPNMAGRTEVEVRYNPSPMEPPHKLAMNVKSGTVDWKNQCQVLLDEREVIAGDVLHFKIAIKDAHGNATGGAVSSMFLARLDNAGNTRTCSSIAPVPNTNTFTFTATAVHAGDAHAYVAYQGNTINSPRCRVLPGPVHFPKCSLDVPDASAAGAPCDAKLLLADKYGNPTSLGSLTVHDFTWVLENMGTPTDGSTRSTSKRLVPTSALGQGMPGLSKPHVYSLTFEPHLKGVVDITCTCAKDEAKHKLQKKVKIEGGLPDLRSSIVKVSPLVVRAGQTVTVEVLVKDSNRNTAPFDLKDMTVTISNERDTPVPSAMELMHGGFKFTFVPTRQGKARARLKYKLSRDKSPVESQAVTVNSDLYSPSVSSVKIEPGSVVAGNPVTAFVTLKDRYKNNLASDADVLEELQKALNFTVLNGYAKVSVEECKVRGTVLTTEFCPTERGKASLRIDMKSVDGALESNEIDVRPGPLDFNHCSVVLDADSCPINTAVSMIVTTKDKFNNITTGARAEYFTIEVFNEEAAVPAPKLLGKDKASTAFTAQIYPTTVGNCYCEVTYYPPDGEESLTRKSNSILITS